MGLSSIQYLAPMWKTHTFFVVVGNTPGTLRTIHVRTILYNRVTHVYEVIIVFTLPEIEPRASTCCPNGILLSNCFSPWNDLLDWECTARAYTV